MTGFDIDIARRTGAATISLSFRSDALVTALVGPSGIGKTTVLNMIAGILKPDRGRVAVGSTLLFDSTHAINVPLEQRRCGYTFQDDRLFPHMSVFGNLTYGQKLTPMEQRWATLDEVVTLLGLGHLLDRRPRTLSGGESRRVAIGRALLASPAFLLMDEPLNSLDADRREAMLQAIEDIRTRYALPILYVSHQQDEVARLAETIITMPPLARSAD